VITNFCDNFYPLCDNFVITLKVAYCAINACNRL